MKSQKVLLGVLAGVATGALLGVLFAPDQGAKTRKKITGKGEAFTDMVKDKITNFLEAIAGKFDTGEDKNVDLAKQTKEEKKEKKLEV